MDIFNFTKSKTRQKILNLFLAHPKKDYYLSEIEKIIDISRGNIRRELLTLIRDGLFRKYQTGRLVYYHLNTNSLLYNALSMLIGKNSPASKGIIEEGYLWVTKSPPTHLSEYKYCSTRDVFQVRLESYSAHLEDKLGTDAFLLTAVTGEIGNNSFDHNLGQWRDVPGVYFAYDNDKKIIVLADRGQGVLKTISCVLSQVKTDKEALNVAFTRTISGRSPEKRGNGLKFVSQIIKDKKWSLQFDSGRSSLTIDSKRTMNIKNVKTNIKGTLAVIKY